MYSLYMSDLYTSTSVYIIYLSNLMKYLGGSKTVFKNRILWAVYLDKITPL